MGAKPPPAAVAAAILPETVADGFTSVYYKLAAKQPAQLAQLYGEDSEVSHTAGETLIGLASIGAATRALPLANKPAADVATVDAMSTGAGGYVVVVAGALEGATFTQTFVLCPADGDKVGHFYCRNDIFRFVSAAREAAAASAPADALAAPRAEPVQIASGGATAGDEVEQVTESNSPAAFADISVANGHDGEGEETDGYDTDEEGDDEDESETEDEEATVNGPNHITVQGGAEKAVEGTAVESDSGIATSTTKDVPTLAAATTGTPDEDAPKKVVPEGIDAKATATTKTEEKPESGTAGPPAAAGKPAVPAKPKTWASIVSTASGGTPAAAASGATVPAAPAPATVANVTNSAPPKLEAPTGSKPDTGPTGSSYNAASKSGYSGGHGSSHPHHSHQNQQHNNDNSGSGGWSSVDNKRHSNNHHGHHSHDGGFQKVMSNGQYGHNTGFNKHIQGRVYGPSAVIQLNTLPMDRAKDWRTLQSEFYAEFNSYGFPVRNVEVKTHKGLAFIEYGDQAGVRAAVAAWADGPRDEGNFKGIALSVTEKRQRRPHIPGEGGPPGRGGRGGMRGGRGGGRGRGRGMPYASNGGAGPEASGAQAPATSTF